MKLIVAAHVSIAFVLVALSDYVDARQPRPATPTSNPSGSLASPSRDSNLSYAPNDTPLEAPNTAPDGSPKDAPGKAPNNAPFDAPSDDPFQEPNYLPFEEPNYLPSEAPTNNVCEPVQTPTKYDQPPSHTQLGSNGTPSGRGKGSEPVKFPTKYDRPPSPTKNDYKPVHSPTKL